MCSKTDKLLRCSRCQQVYYCSREHQKKDWRDHKVKCIRAAPMPEEGSSESEILKSMTENLTPHLAMPVKGAKGFSSEKAFSWCSPKDLGEVCLDLIRDMNTFGVCVQDNFLGESNGKKVLLEVLNMYHTQGVFNDGQLVSSRSARDMRAIRGDQITWIGGGEQSCSHIRQLITHVDTVVRRANKMPNNGKLGNYNINGRTKVCEKAAPFYPFCIIDLNMLLLSSACIFNSL